MGKYKVFIEETILGEFNVEASSLEEARTKAIDMYNKDEFNATEANLEKVQIKVSNSKEETEWEEI